MVQKAGLRILNSFQNENLRTFVDLCKEAGYPTDLGGYYLRQLVRSDYLSKGERGEYLLSARGRRYLTSQPKTGTSPRLLVLIVAEFDRSFVILKRKKQPFLDRKEWPASAIRRGESAAAAVKRLLEERILPSENITYKGTFRRIDFYDDELFDDKVFLVHTVKLDNVPPAEVSSGENLCVPSGTIDDLTHASRSLKDILLFSRSDKPYAEHQYHLTYKDFEPEKEVQS